MNMLAVGVLALGVAHIKFDLQKNWRAVYVTKPLTMALIICWALVSASFPLTAFGKWMLAGLGFSLCGDVFLMLRRERFLAGLCSFLVGHLCYVAAFLTAGSQPPLWAWLTLFAICVGLSSYLWSHLGSLKIPVLVYSLVIMSMGVMAIGLAYAQTPFASAPSAITGALLFVFSDACLAINRFRRPLPASPVWVMGSYFSAQWFLATAIAG